MTNRSRGWIFTEFDMTRLSKMGDIFADSDYLVFAPEVCPSTDREHIQGYVHFKSQRTFTSVCKMLPQTRVEVAAGSPKQNRDYIFGPYDDGKGKTKPFNPKAVEIGVMPRMGKRNDLDSLIVDIIENKNVNEQDLIRDYGGTWARNYKAIDRVVSAFEEKRNWLTKIVYIWGKTGIGKSRMAYEAGAVPITLSDKFILGYKGEDNVLFDDIDEWTFFKKRSWFLRITDRYPCSVDIKGSERNWKPKVIYITSNYPPSKTLNFHPDKDVIDDAVLRRINEGGGEIIYMEK